MSITLNHGNIATALGLASLAGRADRAKVVGQQDLQFLGLMQGAQADADRNYATQIQLALADKQHTRDADIQQQQLALHQQNVAQQQSNADRDYGLQTAHLGLDQQRLAANVTDQNADRQIAQQRANTEQQGLALRTVQPHGDPVKMRQYVLSVVPPEQQANALAYLDATGKIPDNLVPQKPSQSAGLDTDYRMKQADFGRLKTQLADAENQLRSLTLGGGKLGPIPVQGQEAAFQAATQRVATTRASLAALEDALKSAPPPLTGSALPPGYAAPPAAPTGPGGSPVINTPAEYAALPSGTVYVDGATGRRARKP